MHYNFCRPHLTLKGRASVQAAGRGRKFKELKLTHYLHRSRSGAGRRRL
jgi:hypothetical protein